MKLSKCLMTVVKESMELTVRQERVYEVYEDRLQDLKSRWIRAECSRVDASRSVGEGAVSRRRGLLPVSQGRLQSRLHSQ